MTQWQTIETAPKDGTEIIVYVPPDTEGSTVDGVGCAVWSDYYDCFVDSWEEWGQYRGATHWMPMPTPPEGK